MHVKLPKQTTKDRLWEWHNLQRTEMKKYTENRFFQWSTKQANNLLKDKCIVVPYITLKSPES